MARSLGEQFAQGRPRNRHLLRAATLRADEVHSWVRLISLAGANDVAIVHAGDAVNEPCCFELTKNAIHGNHVYRLTYGGKSVANVVCAKRRFRRGECLSNQPERACKPPA